MTHPPVAGSGAGPRAALAVAGLLALATPAAVGAMPFTVVKVPGSDGADAVPAVDGAAVIVVDASAVRLFEGGSITVIADTSTSIPGGSGAFAEFQGLASADAGVVVFRGVDSTGQEGVYRWSGGVLDVVADSGSTIPGGTGTFTGFGGASVSLGRVAFQGTGSDGQRGIYVSAPEEALAVIADTSTLVPGTSDPFRGLGGPSISENEIVFQGGVEGGSQLDVFVHRDGGIEAIARQGTILPPGFSGLVYDPPALSEGALAFAGLSFCSDPLLCPEAPGGLVSGLYLERDGAVDLVVDSETPVPGTGDFFNVGTFALDGDTLVLRHSTDSSLWLFADGTLTKLIDRNQPLDGQVVTTLVPGHESLDGPVLAFFVRTHPPGVPEQTETAIYRLFLPEPPAALLAALALAGVATLRRR